MRQPADREDLVRAAASDRRCRRCGRTSTTSCSCPAFQNRCANAARASASMSRAGDRERVDPQRLDLDRLADPRRDHAVADLRVHPRQLQAGLAAREQAVGVGADAVARAARVAVDDRARRASRSSSGRGRSASRRRRSRTTAPRRRELYSGVASRSPNRFGSMPRSTAPAHSRRIARAIVAPAARQAQPAQRDERVAAPVGEPRIAGDDRAAGAARDEVRVGRAVEPGACASRRTRSSHRSRPIAERERRPGRSNVNMPGDARSSSQSSPRAASAREIEVAVPLGRVIVVTRVAAHDRGHAVVRPPRHRVAARLGRRTGSARSRDASRGSRAARAAAAPTAAPARPRPLHRSVRARRARHAPTSSHAIRVPSGNSHSQRGHGCAVERRQALRTVGIDDVAAIAMRRQREPARRRLDEHLEIGDEHHARVGRPRRREQHRVIAARADAVGGAHREAAQAVGLEPFRSSRRVTAGAAAALERDPLDQVRRRARSTRSGATRRGRGRRRRGSTRGTARGRLNAGSSA